MTMVRDLIFPLCLALLMLADGAARAESPPPAPSASSSESVSIKVIEARLQEVEGSTEYDEATKNSLMELYRKALSSLESMAANDKTAKAFSQARVNAADKASKLNAIYEQRKRDQTPVTLDIAEDTPLAEIENRLLKEEADNAAIAAKLNSLEQELDTETQRPDQARQSLTEARTEQDGIDTELKKPAPGNELPALNEARKWLLLARYQELVTRVNMLDQELLSQPMRLELLNAQRDTTALNLKRSRERLKILERRVNEQRRSEVERVVAEATTSGEQTYDQHPVVRALAKANTQSSEQLTKLSRRLDGVTSGDQIAADQAKRIEDEFRRTQKKLEVAGLSQVLGQILLEQRRQLPDNRHIQREVRKRESLIAETALNQLQNSEELRKLLSLKDYVDTLTATLDQDTAVKIRPVLLELAKTRLNLLKQLDALGNTYLRALGELDYAQHRLIDAINSYNAFLDERLLWVRSSPAPSVALLLATPAQALELLSPVNWYDALVTLNSQLVASGWPLLVALLVITLVWKRRAMKQRLLDTGKAIIKPRTDKFRYSLQALGLTLLIALPWPLLLWTFGWSMSTSLEASAFTKSLARALVVLSPAFFYLSAFRMLCMPGGLADRHFRWPTNSLQPLRNQLSILMATFLPAAMIAVASIHYGSRIEGALSRIAFVVVMGSMAWFFYRLFGPREPVLAAEFNHHPDSLLSRFRYVWMALALVIPLLLVVLATAGFLYTAATLTGSLIDTLWLILGFLVIHQMAVRWLVQIRRKLDFQAALERRRAALEAARKENEHKDDQVGDEIEQEEPEIDLVALNQESMKLLDSAIVLGGLLSLWFIWADVLPAFSGLKDFALWHYTGTVDGVSSLVPVTLADIIVALLIGVITLVAARRFPALLEIVLLKRSSVTSGGRYAATTLSRYVIAAVGSLLVLSTIGAKWSQVQWLAAALSVGIGFGLQEIVANFISGIIILFERPIRVGDVVTVGDTDGTVTRIQIRATTIRTWDRQELLVPNKEFITGRLLNWSLSDQITRIRIPVGVAYGSDVSLARSLMLLAAEENSMILSDPAPATIFIAFGDNTLNLELRCFVGAQEHRMVALTQIHEAIDRKFNEAGIVIAFPQRDVHLDTSQPLDVRIHRDGDKPGNDSPIGDK
jgi:potassium-dependent mechanosensitive channel